MNNLILLPIELFPFIFNCLDLKDLTGLRVVCKRLRSIVDDCAFIDELAITYFKRNDKYHSPNRYLHKWHHIKTPINLDNVIRNDLSKSNEFKYFKREIINQNLIKNLRRLKLIIQITNENQNVLNYYIQKLTKLEQFDLEIRNYYTDLISLKHPNLKIFYLILTCTSNVKIDFPNLEIIDYPFLESKFVFINYEKIRHLSSVYSRELETNLLKFKNLESIHIGYFNNPSILNNLFELTKLKLIEFTSIPSQNSLVDFYLMKENLKRDDIIVYFRGTKISNLNELNEYYSNMDIWV